MAVAIRVWLSPAHCRRRRISWPSLRWHRASRTSGRVQNSGVSPGARTAARMARPLCAARFGEVDWQLTALYHLEKRSCDGLVSECRRWLRDASKRCGPECVPGMPWARMEVPPFPPCPGDRRPGARHLSACPAQVPGLRRLRPGESGVADIGLHHLLSLDDVISHSGLHEDDVTMTSARLNDGQLVIMITFKAPAAGAGTGDSSPCGAAEPSRAHE